MWRHLILWLDRRHRRGERLHVRPPTAPRRTRDAYPDLVATPGRGRLRPWVPWGQAARQFLTTMAVIAAAVALLWFIRESIRGLLLY